MVASAGIEPASADRESAVLPLNDEATRAPGLPAQQVGGPTGTRTPNSWVQTRDDAVSPSAHVKPDAPEPSAAGSGGARSKRCGPIRRTPSGLKRSTIRQGSDCRASILGLWF